MLAAGVGFVAEGEAAAGGDGLGTVGQDPVGLGQLGEAGVGFGEAGLDAGHVDVGQDGHRCGVDLTAADYVGNLGRRAHGDCGCD